MRTLIVMLTGVVIMAGCARVQVEAPKEPIKVDISMRLDVYQHVEQDIDEIENIVSGSSSGPQSKIVPALMNFVVSEAYAGEGLSSDVEKAALRRRDRHAQLSVWEKEGVIGENKSGLIEIRKTEQTNKAIEVFIEAENKDRMVIYKGIADKNGTSVGEVQKLYAKRLQGDAPSGTPVETLKADGSYEWSTKP